VSDDDLAQELIGDQLSLVPGSIARALDQAHEAYRRRLQRRVDQQVAATRRVQSESSV